MTRWKQGAVVAVLTLSSAFATQALADKGEGSPPAAKPGAPMPKDGKGMPAKPQMEGHGKPDPKDHGHEHGKSDEHAKGHGHGKPDERGGPGDKGPGDKGQGDEAARAERRAERQKRAKALRAEMRKKIASTLKGRPMALAMKQELKRHARRTARLDRIKALAEAAKDEDSLARVNKLIEKENARHEKWMAHFDGKLGAMTPDKAREKVGDKANPTDTGNPANPEGQQPEGKARGTADGKQAEEQEPEGAR